MSNTPALQAFEKQKKNRLYIGLLFDFLGMATYFFPAIGEVGDLAWAPIAAATFFGMYRGLTGLVGGSFVFIEEVFPITDFMPTFTLTWLWVYMIRGEKSKKRFLKGFNNEEPATDSVDITDYQDKKKLTT